MKTVIAFLILLLPNEINAQIITTVAGNGTGGFGGDNGLAILASVGNMGGIVFDDSNNYYLCEGNNTIRKISHTGIISTVAGNGNTGYNGDNILALTASFNTPVFAAVDRQGNLYISDENNNRIRKIDAATEIISTIAGNGIPGYSGDSGLAVNATINAPYGITLDTAGNIYFADHLNFIIRKINASGVITTVAGNGTQGFSGDSGLAISAQLTGILGICTDHFANLFLTDGARIRKVNLNTGIITTVAGNGIPGFSGDNSVADLAQISFPVAVAVDKFENLFIAEIGNNRVRMVNSSGIISTVAGNGSTGYNGDSILATTASIFSPRGIALDKCNNLFVSDNSNRRIRKITFDISCGLNDTTTLVNSIAINSSINIYPNPATNTIIITCPDKIISIAVINMLGQTVYSKEYHTSIYGEGKAELDISKFSNGVYYLQLRSSNNIEIRKIIKQ